MAGRDRDVSAYAAAVAAGVAIGVLGSGSVNLSATPLAVVARGVAAGRVGTARWARGHPSSGL